MTKINVEISEDYKAHLDLLKQIIPNKDGEQVKSDGEMVEVLIDEFISFVEQHAQAENSDGECCGGQGHGKDHDHGHEHGKGGCGCSH